MSSITTINGSDQISTSRTVINTNFSNLNTDKMETSVLDTDTTLTANSDAKVATQKAVKTYVDAVVSPVGKSWNEYAASSNGTDSYAITVAGVTAYVVGQVYKFRADVANTGAASLNVNGLGAKTLKKNVSYDLSTGDIAAGQIVTVIYDISGNMQVVSSISSSTVPVIYKYDTVSSEIGDSTTRFDITNPSGTTFRYTWDSTGTNPNISSANNPVGTLINFQAQNFSSGNNGVFIVTGSGSNYIEVTNASGVVESDKTIGTGYVVKSGTTGWTKPAGLKYITIEVVGGGGGGGNTTLNRDADGGGGAGGYARKIISASNLSSTEYMIIGGGGAAETNGRLSSFTFNSSLIIANGGSKNIDHEGGDGGSASGGDINITGGDGGNVDATYSGSSATYYGGFGGSNPLSSQVKTVPGNSNNGKNGHLYGGGGSGSAAQSGGGASSGGAGAQGVIILTEYYG